MEDVEEAVSEEVKDVEDAVTDETAEKTDLEKEETTDVSNDSSSKSEQQESPENLQTVAEGLEDTDNVQDTDVYASDLKWDNKGNIIFKMSQASAYYGIGLFRDGVFVDCVDTLTWMVDAFGYGGIATFNVLEKLDESGSYTFKVKSRTDWSENLEDFTTGYVVESPVLVYEKPSEKLAMPTGLQCSSDGKVTWNPVENASMYEIVWDGLANTNDPDMLGLYIVGTSVDMDNDLLSYYNKLAIRAITNDMSKYLHSDWVEMSLPLKDLEEVKETLNEILQNEDVDEAVSDLKDSSKVDKGEIRRAMQNDEEISAKIKALEENYKDAKGIEVAAPTVTGIDMDVSKVAILGAALNAEESQRVELKISKPDKEISYNPNVYKNVVQFSMDMYIDDAATTELDVPVTITLPIPDGMNTLYLRILHYTSTGDYETIFPRYNGDGTLSFTITHFSTFAFVEEVEATVTPEKPETNVTTTEKAKGDSRSSENVVKVKAWKPTTPDEVKRYACMGKEAVNYTLAANNAYAVVVRNVMQGPKCFASFEAVLGDYTIGRTYNIYPAGKPVYSMDNEIEVTIKIPSAIYKAGREYKMICVTKDGQPIILDDLDLNPETITIRTNKFYAFALIYK